MKTLGNVAYNADLATKEYVDTADKQNQNDAWNLVSTLVSEEITKTQNTYDTEMAYIKSEYVTSAEVDAKLSNILQNLTTRTFTLNASLVGATNNLKTWGYTSDIPTADLTFTCAAHPSYFSKLDANGFTITTTGASNKNDWPLYVEISANNGFGKTVLGTAVINYSSINATATSISKTIYVYTGTA
jgi:hypothetical protein